MEAREEIDKSLAAGKPFQLIISDWNMTDYTGLQLLKHVRANSRTSWIPFIILTSNTEKEYVMEAIRAGVTNYLAKPFPIEVLEKKIREAWESTRKNRKSG